MRPFVWNLKHIHSLITVASNFAGRKFSVQEGKTPYEGGYYALDHKGKVMWLPGGGTTDNPYMADILLQRCATALWNDE